MVFRVGLKVIFNILGGDEGAGGGINSGLLLRLKVLMIFGEPSRSTLFVSKGSLKNSETGSLMNSEIGSLVIESSFSNLIHSKMFCLGSVLIVATLASFSRARCSRTCLVLR